VVNVHKSAAHTDSSTGSTGKTCLGRGMHCPSACISLLLLLYYHILKTHCMLDFYTRPVSKRKTKENCTRVFNLY